MAEETLCLLTPSVVGRRWLVEVEEKQVDEESGEEKTVDVVKELSKDKANEVLRRIEEAGFKVRDTERCVLTRDLACQFLAASDCDCNDEVVRYLTSGPVIALRLAKEGARDALLGMIGPEDPEEARELDRQAFGEDVGKWSLRGAFGALGVRNGVRASTTALMAAQQINFFFPEPVEKWERSLAIVSAVNGANYGQVLAGTGLCVIKQAEVSAVPPALLEAYPVLRETEGAAVFVVEGFSAVTKLARMDNKDGTLLYVSTGPEVAQRDVEAWFSELEIQRMLIVSFSAEQALELERLVRRFGFEILAHKKISSREIISISRQGETAHAYVVAKAGALETSHFLVGQHASLDVYTSQDFGWLFPQLDVAPDLDKFAARSFIRKAESRGSKGSEPQLVQSVLTSALTELCKAKPAGLDAVRELGEWLLRNNPDREAAERAEAWIAARRRPGQAAAAAASPSADARAAPAAPTDAQVPLAPAALGQAKGKKVVLVLGAPGSGKGTQCEFLAAQFGYDHISTGELLRREVEQGTALGKSIEAVMQQGKLVDKNVVVQVLSKAIKRHTAATHVLIDGFPRDMEQVEAFEQLIGPPTFVLNMTLERELIKERLLKRKRADDTEEVIESRINTFLERSRPVIEHYERKGKVRTVHVSRRDDGPEHVLQRVIPCFQPELVVLASADGALVGRVAAELATTAGYEAIDMAAIIAREARTGSPLGQRIREILARDQRVPTDMRVSLVRGAIQRSGACKFTLVGFPLSLEECEALERELCPAARNIVFRSTVPKSRAFTRDTAPLLDFLRDVGRLSEVDARGLTADQCVMQCGLGRSPGFLLRSNSEGVPAADPALVQVDVAEAPHFEPGTAPFVVNGLPTEPEQAHALFEHLGAPLAVFASAEDRAAADNSVLTKLALEGKLRQGTASQDALGRDVVVLLGSSAAPAALIQQLAREQGLALLDYAKALAALPTCAGTWEARAVLRAEAAAQEVPSDAAEGIAADLAFAKAHMVERAARSSPSRGVLLVNMDADADLLASPAFPASRVLVLEEPPATVAAKQLAAASGDEEPEEGALEALTAEVESAQSRLRAAAAAAEAAGGWSVVNAPADADELLRALRAPFTLELFTLVAPRSDKARALCAGLAKRLDIVPVRVAEVFRRETESGSAMGRVIAEALRAQSSVPLETSVTVIQAELSRLAASGARSFLLDGFPSASGDSFPFAHDQLFAIEKHVGPLPLCIHLGAVEGAVEGKVVELFGSLGRLAAFDVSLSTEELVDEAARKIELIRAERAEVARRDGWQPGDGSPEAQLQEVLDRFEPRRSETRAAEEYWMQFSKADSEHETTYDEVQARMNEWSIETSPESLLTETQLPPAVVTKAQWYEFVYSKLLNMDEAEVRRQKEAEAAAAAAAAEEAAAEAEA